MAASDDKKVLWRTGRRILYDTPGKVAAQSTLPEDDNVLAYRDLDRWVSEEGIFMHAADYEMDEIY
jgi:hypothetical protein